MPEIVSREAARLAASATGLGKARYTDGLGKVRAVVITTPATHALAQNDTIASGIRLPIGTRILGNSFVSNAAMGASVALAVGLRNFDTKVPLSSTAIANTLVVNAQRAVLNNGAYIVDGGDYVTDQPTEIYCTFTGADPTDNAQCRVEVMVVTPD